MTVIVETPAVAPAVTVNVTVPPGVDALMLAGLTVATAVFPLTAVKGPVLFVSLTVNVVVKPVPFNDIDAGDANGIPGIGVGAGVGDGVGVGDALGDGDGDGDVTGVVVTGPLHAANVAMMPTVM
jgi:hypothetical protein